MENKETVNTEKSAKISSKRKERVRIVTGLVCKTGDLRGLYSGKA